MNLESLEPRQVLAADVFGSADAAGTFTFGTRDDAGAITILQVAPDGSPSRLNNFGAALGAPASTGAPLTWTDPVDGHTYAAAPSNDGVIVYTQYAKGVWGFERITSSLGAPAFTNLTQFTGQDGSVTVAGIQANGDLAAIIKAPGGAWSYRNLSDDLRAEGLETPRFVGKLVSYVTSWDGRNIAGLDADGNIQAVWRAPGIENDHWRTDNLSQLTGTAPFSDSLTAYVNPWGGINLAGLDDQGHVRVTWWTPGGIWQTSDLTVPIDGPSFQPGNLSSYVTSWGGTNIVGRDLSGALSIYWWAPGLETWVVSSALVPGSPRPAGSITGIASPTGSISLVTTDSDGLMSRYHWAPGDAAWSYDHVQARARRAVVGEIGEDVDFLALTGLDQVGASLAYDIDQPNPFSQDTAYTRITPGPGGFFRWSMQRFSETMPDLAIQRRPDGAFLDLNTLPTAGLAELGGLGFDGQPFRIALSSPASAFVNHGSIEARLPEGWTGQASGTVESSVHSEGTHVVRLGTGAVQATVLQWNFSMDLNGTVDIKKGDGPQDTTMSVDSVMTLYCIPGLGMVKIDHSVTGSMTADGKTKLESAHAVAQLTLPKLSA